MIKGNVNGETAWWKVVNGQVIFDNDVSKNSNGWWKISNGKVDFGFNGIASNKNGLWLIQNGKVNFDYYGSYDYNGSIYIVLGGQATFVQDSHMHYYEHAYNVEATCTTDGYEVQRCKYCGDERTLITSGPQHKYEVTETKYTCLSSEAVQTLVCSVCNDKKENTIDLGQPLEHDFECEVIEAATCKRDGVQKRTCKRCGYSDEAAIPANNSDHVFEVTDRDEKKVVDKEATTGKVGVLRYSRQQCNPCIHFYGVAEEDARWNFESELEFHQVYESDQCGSSSVVGAVIYEDVQIPEKAHYVITGVTYICKECGCSYHTTAVDHQHKIEDTTLKEADCNNMGLVRHTCSVCGFSWDEQTQRLGHEYKYASELSFKGSCKKKAYRVYQCTRCGDLYKMTSTKKEVAHMPDDYITEYVHCTGGITSCMRYSHCETCGYSELAYVKDWYTKETIKEPTETEYGIDRYTCQECHQSIDVKIPKAGTPDSDIANNYTVSKDHKATIYTCKNCGDWYYGPEKISEDETYYNFYHYETISIHDCEK